MNKYDEKYEIRFARRDEIDEVMDFIDTHWKKGHILARNRDFFEYEMVIDGQVNFLIAREKETGMIHGLLGFLPASQSKEKYDIWSVVWKVVEGALPFLGVEMQKRMGEHASSRFHLGIGSNPKTTVPLAGIMLHHKVAKMRHFYCLAEKEDYKIAKISHYEPFMEEMNYQVKLVKLNNINELRELYDFKYNEQCIPYKDAWYVNRRFFQHPIYTYEVYGLQEDGETQALLICREQECNGAKVLRIVDYIGKPELFGGISGFLKAELQKYEYIDLYCHGFDTSYVRQAGMVELQENDGNIIPNYFAPYVAENIDIWVHSPINGCVFFKADGDQDRPN